MNPTSPLLLRKADPLPFTVSLIKTAEQLRLAVAHRARGYTRRSASMGAALEMPEPADQRAAGRDILIAQSKLDGSVLGSMRLQINHAGPLMIERQFDFPPPFKGARLMHASRFCVTAGAVCLKALLKGAIAYGKIHNADYFVICTIPSLRRFYDSGGFAPIFEEGHMVRIESGGNEEHLAMGLDLRNLREEIMARRPAMAPFLFELDHGSDIDVSDAWIPGSEPR